MKAIPCSLSIVTNIKVGFIALFFSTTFFGCAANHDSPIVSEDSPLTKEIGSVISQGPIIRRLVLPEASVRAVDFRCLAARNVPSQPAPGQILEQRTPTDGHRIFLPMISVGASDPQPPEPPDLCYGAASSSLSYDGPGLENDSNRVYLPIAQAPDDVFSDRMVLNASSTVNAASLSEVNPGNGYGSTYYNIDDEREFWSKARDARYDLERCRYVPINGTNEYRCFIDTGKRNGDDSANYPIAAGYLRIDPNGWPKGEALRDLDRLKWWEKIKGTRGKYKRINPILVPSTTPFRTKESLSEPSALAIRQTPASLGRETRPYTGITIISTIPMFKLNGEYGIAVQVRFIQDDPTFYSEEEGWMVSDVDLNMGGYRWIEFETLRQLIKINATDAEIANFENTYESLPPLNRPLFQLEGLAWYNMNVSQQVYVQVIEIGLLATIIVLTAGPDPSDVIWIGLMAKVATGTQRAEAPNAAPPADASPQAPH